MGFVVRTVGVRPLLALAAIAAVMGLCAAAAEAAVAPGGVGAAGPVAVADVTCDTPLVAALALREWDGKGR